MIATRHQLARRFESIYEDAKESIKHHFQNENIFVFDDAPIISVGDDGYDDVLIDRISKDELYVYCEGNEINEYNYDNISIDTLLSILEELEKGAGEWINKKDIDNYYKV